MIWQLAEARRRLAAAEEALAGTQAAMKRAEGEFDAANDRVDAAERALDDAWADRRQPCGPGMPPGKPTSGAAAGRVQRRVEEISGGLEQRGE